MNYYYYSSMINSREILRFLSFDKLGNRYRYETSIYKRNFFKEDLLLKDFMYVNFISRFFFSIESILSRKIFLITYNVAFFNNFDVSSLMLEFFFN